MTSTSSITGTKLITNVGHKDRSMDAQLQQPKNQIVGNPPNFQQGSTQKWNICHSPDKQSATYFIYNEHFKKYLCSEGPNGQHLILILSDKKCLWDIVPVAGGKDYYKLQVHNVGTVCSLTSSAPGTRVVIDNFKGENETWHLQDFPTPRED